MLSSITKRASMVAILPAAIWGLAACSAGAPVEGTPAASVNSSTGGTVPLIASYTTFTSAGELIDASDAVVRGRLVSENNDELRPQPPKTNNPEVDPQAGMSPEEIAKLPGVAITVFTMEVDDVLSGEVPGDRIEVVQLGGRMDGIEYRSPDAVLSVDPQQEYVLVLSDVTGGRFDLPNPEQSAYTVDQGNQITPVSGSNDLGVTTTEQLVQLADPQGA